MSRLLTMSKKYWSSLDMMVAGSSKQGDGQIYKEMWGNSLYVCIST